MKDGETQLLLRQAQSHLRVAAALLTAAGEELNDDDTIDMFSDDEYDEINNLRHRIKAELKFLSNFLGNTT